MNKQIAAFFDIDGTLYREGLITEVFKKLIKSEIIQPSRWYNEVKPYYVKWDKRQGNYDNYLLKMAEIYTEAIKGLHESQVEFIAKLVVDQKGDRVYTYTRDRISYHKKNNHKVIAISGSPIELVKNMCEKYGFDDYIGSIYEKQQDKYTGNITPMWDSVSKNKAINTFKEKYNLDLTNSYSYGDTSGDYTMMHMVGNPVAINPTKELLMKIMDDDMIRNKIKIIVERKDVVYNLSPQNIEF
ncbi:HAD-superfamily subfamily IB hydrolase, TIGR01490 [Hathewaya proteolytica DSM 3090]|uniref:phosphoserine phosphatase n=1 Tax=Hathewaya proteolytica DSM 3090 TaxID=1121331 RepID=A0A1M6J1V8_9CLOT|nr:HAD-IB family hydrolase [Hathewaya proteolytica]SHJ40675.1 HAD-superfamily subfamily IB hydrolase, TIGR01490 [Hathewaya proteolytica DSM 3090]